MEMYSKIILNTKYMIDLEKQAYIEEYISLRNEINQRSQYQIYILGINVASISTFFSLTGFNFNNITLLLLISIVYCIIAWIYIEQDVFLTQAAGYLNKVLRKNIIKRISESYNDSDKLIIKVMEWENYRNRILFKKLRNKIFLKLMVLFRSLAAYGPSIIIFLTFCYYLLFDRYVLNEIKLIDYILLAINFIFLLLLGYQFVIIIKLYREIAD